jgi:hypothetical protein
MAGDGANPWSSALTNPRAEAITSVERRWRWPRAENERLVAASLEQGAPHQSFSHWQTIPLFVDRECAKGDAAASRPVTFVP